MPLTSLIGMMNAACPRVLSSGSTVAVTTWMSLIPPLVAHAFWPLMTHSSVFSSYFARVRMFETSEPALGSEEQNAATFTSVSLPKQRGMNSPICSPVPVAAIEATARPVPMIAIPMPASPQKSSSLTIGIVRPDGSAKNCASPSKPYSPILAASWMIGHGRLLALVPLVGGRAHDVRGEPVDPVADVLLILVQLQGEGGLLRRRRSGRVGRRDRAGFHAGQRRGQVNACVQPRTGDRQAIAPACEHGRDGPERRHQRP